MKEFKEIHEYITTNAKRLNACSSEYSRALKSKNVDDLLTVVKDNIYWCISNRLFTAENIADYFGIEKLNEHDIYVSQKFSKTVEKESVYLVLLGSSSATVKTWGSSSATVKTLDSSSATVKTWGSSSKLSYELKSTSLGIIKDLNAKKLIVYKSAFEIIEIS
jgi:hypothetical protein